MRARFTQSFKIQAVEKALSRSDSITLKEIAEELGVGLSTLGKWIIKARNNGFGQLADNMTKSKRPKDFTLEERLNLVIRCGSLGEREINQLCREEGLYPHHIKQWKEDFANGQTITKGLNGSENKQLKAEVKTLKREIIRKDKALAETAALLVLQKKVQAIWGNEEDN